MGGGRKPPRSPSPRIPRCPGDLYRVSIARVWLRPEYFPGIGAPKPQASSVNVGTQTDARTRTRTHTLLVCTRTRTHTLLVATDDPGLHTSAELL
jgi:hypothetical protein